MYYELIAAVCGTATGTSSAAGGTDRTRGSVRTVRTDSKWWCVYRWCGDYSASYSDAEEPEGYAEGIS